MLTFQHPLVRQIVSLALLEDIGTGDWTTQALIEKNLLVQAEIYAKAEGVVAGLGAAAVVFDEVDRNIQVTFSVSDGTFVTPSMVVLRAEGPVGSFLTAERTALNFVMRLSGVATHTRRFVDALRGTKTRILDTRKTTPGLRLLEKQAVRAGGGSNHRMNLSSGVLIKNNHLAVQPDIAVLIDTARKNTPILTRIEVEVRTVQEAKDAIAGGADMLLLDHMTPEDIVTVVSLCKNHCQTEASGNMTLDSVASIAALGVDFISAGSLTRDATWLDFSMGILEL